MQEVLVLGVVVAVGMIEDVTEVVVEVALVADVVVVVVVAS